MTQQGWVIEATGLDAFPESGGHFYVPDAIHRTAKGIRDRVESIRLESWPDRGFVGFSERLPGQTDRRRQ